MSNISSGITILEDDTNTILFNGDILIDEEDGWFEGMDNNQKEMVFGIFKRFKSIKICNLNENAQINMFDISRTLFTYCGVEKTHGGKKLNVEVIVIYKENNPRDMDTSDKEHFSNELTEFKKRFLTGENGEIYNNFYSKREEIKNDSNDRNVVKED